MIFLSSPLEQFQIIPVIPISFSNFNFSITNSTIISFIGLLSFLYLLFLLLNKDLSYSFIPNRWQTIIETFYELIADLLIKDIVGIKAQGFFPSVFTIFIFILISNLIGLIPYSFTSTSHLIITFSLATFIFLAINIICIKTHKLNFFSLFLP